MPRSIVLVAGVGLLLVATPLFQAHAGCTDNLSADRELNIRKGPSTEFEPIGKIPGEACRVRIGTCDDGWCRVNYNGLEGFSSEFYLQKTERDQRRVRRPWRGITNAVFDGLSRDQNWERIGTVDVVGRRDRDVIQFDRRDGRFEALRMRVRGAPVNFTRVVAVYGNGQRDNLDFSRTVRANGESGELELRGHNGRFLERLILVYGKARPTRAKAEVEVWGRHPSDGRRKGGANPDIGFGPGWEALGQRDVARGGDRDEIKVGRADGRFDALGVRVLKNDVRIRRMLVEYGNGRTQEVNIDRRLREGERSDAIELRGQQGRFIRSIRFFYETIGRGPTATVEVWGRVDRS